MTDEALFDHALRVRQRHFGLPDHPLAEPEMAGKPGGAAASGHRGPATMPRSRSTATAPNTASCRAAGTTRGRSRSGSGYVSSGAGFAESALHDEAGRLGRSVQSLFVEHR